MGSPWTPSVKRQKKALVRKLFKIADEQDLNMTDLAEVTGITANTLKRWKYGKGLPTRAAYVEILDEFFEASKPNTPPLAKSNGKAAPIIKVKMHDAPAYVEEILETLLFTKKGNDIEYDLTHKKLTITW